MGLPVLFALPTIYRILVPLALGIAAYALDAAIIYWRSDIPSELLPVRRTPRRRDGAVNRAGPYSRMQSQHSLQGVSEANHVPPLSTYPGDYVRGRGGNLPAISTDFTLHQRTMRVLGTTGRGPMATFIRDRIISYHMRNGRMVEALRFSILADYIGVFRGYSTGIRELFVAHRRLGTITDDQVTVLNSWLDDLIEWEEQDAEDGITGGIALWYLYDKCYQHDKDGFINAIRRQHDR